MIINIDNQLVKVSAIERVSDINYYYWGAGYYFLSFNVFFHEFKMTVWAQKVIEGSNTPKEPTQEERRILEEKHATISKAVLDFYNKSPKDITDKAKSLIDDLVAGWGMCPDIEIEKEHILQHLSENL
jgi:hypothetical protein